MTTIADRVRPYLSPLLAQALDTRTAEGLRKYGQTLDNNHKPDRAKAVHLLQELIDASQYAEWLEVDSMLTPLLTNLANQIADGFHDLTLDELLFKEGHSGAETVQAFVARMHEKGNHASSLVSKPPTAADLVPLTAAMIYHGCAEGLEAAHAASPTVTETLTIEIAALKAEYETLQIQENGLWYPLSMLIELLEKQVSVIRAVELWRGDVAQRRAALAAAGVGS
jgi:hypothetical protein